MGLARAHSPFSATQHGPDWLGQLNRMELSFFSRQGRGRSLDPSTDTKRELEACDATTHDELPSPGQSSTSVHASQRPFPRKKRKDVASKIHEATLISACCPRCFALALFQHHCGGPSGPCHRGLIRQSIIRTESALGWPRSPNVLSRRLLLVPSPVGHATSLFSFSLKRRRHSGSSRSWLRLAPARQHSDLLPVGRMQTQLHSLLPLYDVTLSPSHCVFDAFPLMQVRGRARDWNAGPDLASMVESLTARIDSRAPWHASRPQASSNR